MKIFAYSAIAFCLLCHHHLFHRHAKACGGNGVAVQSFGVQSFAVPVRTFAVQSNVVVRQPRVVRTRTVIRN